MVSPEELATQHAQLVTWVRELEAFIATTTKHTMPQSNWGKLKARLVRQRPEFLPNAGKPLG